MFVEALSHSSVKKVAAVMYGNGVPSNNVVKCFHACNGLNSSFVTRAIHNWYSIWNTNPHTKHKAQYYSVFFKRWLWINGEDFYRQEAVWPEVTVMQFGIESTGCPLIIRTTIEHVRSCMYKDLRVLTINVKTIY